MGIVCSESCQICLERYWDKVERINEGTLKVYNQKSPNKYLLYCVSVLSAFFVISFLAWLVYIGVVIGRQDIRLR